jgi:predicted RNA binding protein YcfA (HicA-like mRNA interferase family)
VKIGWKPVHQSGSHVKLRHSNHTYSYIWAFHDAEELGPKILARIAKKTGLTPDDL